MTSTTGNRNCAQGCWNEVGGSPGEVCNGGAVLSRSRHHLSHPRAGLVLVHKDVGDTSLNRSHGGVDVIGAELLESSRHRAKVIRL